MCVSARMLQQIVTFVNKKIKGSSKHNEKK